MGAERSSRIQRLREVRWRVVVPARIRHAGSWRDISILNVSSRGLMIHSGRPLLHGAEVEVRRGDSVIVAKVVWREGARAGLKSVDRLAIEEIVTLGQSPALQLTATSGQRPTHSKSEERARATSRSIEFAGVLVIAFSLAGAGVTMVESAFARPLSIVAAALSR